MIYDILFIILIFLIYSHNFSELGYEEIFIRTVLFGISLKYYYVLEPFEINCYPESYEAKTHISYESDGKGWCEDNEPEAAEVMSDGGTDESRKSNECVFGTEALPSYSASSNSKAWCVDRIN